MSVSYGGTVSAINQANSVGQQDNSIQAGISQLNNANLSSYNLLQQGEETKDAGLESEKLAQLGGYTSAIGEKYKEYQDFIKEGGDVKKLKSVKLLDGVADSITGAFDKKPLTYTGPDQAVMDAGQKATEERNASVDAVTEGGADDNAPVETPGPENQGVVDDPAPASSTTETATADNGTVDPAPKPSDTDDSSTLRTLDEAGEEGVGFAGKVARVGGAVFSAGMLGDDIYNQVKDKKFFYGDNTGDKVGNFMNELGSVSDIVGLASGDPLLVMAGVGLGGIGAVVSDVSELFSHHDKVTDKPPPVELGGSTSQNIAGLGAVAETQGSTLRSVQAGGS